MLKEASERYRVGGALLFLIAFGCSIGNASPLEEVLAASGWPPERIRAIENAGALSPEDEVNLLQLAHSLQRFAGRVRSDARQADVVGFQPVNLPVTVTGCAKVDAQGAAWFRCQVDTGEETLEVIANEVPSAWLAERVLPQPAELLALRVSPNLLLAIEWRWLPTEPSYPQVNFGESLLGGLGVDVAALDGVTDGGPLRAIDAAPFYDVLAATRQIGAHQLTRFAQGNLQRYAEQWKDHGEHDTPARRALAAEAKRVLDENRYPIAALFNDALSQRGELYVLDGLARRCVVIETGAAADAGPSVPGRFDVERYYELEVFTPDSRNLPLVFCVLELPDGFPLGDDISVPVRVAGFSFKRWAYRTRKTTDDGADKPQLAPLLIGRAPIPLIEPATNGRWTGLTVGGAFVLALALVWWTLWRTAQSDAQFERDARRRLGSAPDGADLTTLAELDTMHTESDRGRADVDGNT